MKHLHMTALTIRLCLAILLCGPSISGFTAVVAQEASSSNDVKLAEQNEKLPIPIKVMSFNIRYGSANDGKNRWDARSDLVVETIKMFDPDLLGTQEVLKFQADFLKAELPGYAFHGVGRDDGKERGEFVPVMYKRDRFELVSSGHFWLSQTPETPGSKSWDSSLPRMASWVKLSDRNDEGKNFVFVNTHFDHRGKQARLESARLIRNKIEHFLQSEIPVVIAGDFNTTEDGEPYAQLISNEDVRPLVDSYRQANNERDDNESTFSSWNGRRKGSRIDWILHSQEFRTLHSIINRTHDGERYPSDHYPVQSILRLTK